MIPAGSPPASKIAAGPSPPCPSLSRTPTLSVSSPLTAMSPTPSSLKSPVAMPPATCTPSAGYSTAGWKTPPPSFNMTDTEFGPVLETECV